MSNICISNCANDTRNIQVRPTYVNLRKWPESDAEFVRSAGGAPSQSRVVDSVSCRQMYLRSYTFSRKETMPEKTIKCLGKVRQRVVTGRKEEVGFRRRWRRRVEVRRLKVLSCAAVCAVFRRVLFCTATVPVDAVDRGV